MIFLLHGLGATGGTNFAACFEDLGRHFRVIAPDHRGHGRGLRARERFRLEDCAEDVVALADVLGIERFHLVGYSMGGPIAQLVWYLHPRRVEGMVLCATSRNFRGRLREKIQFTGLGLLVGGLGLAPRRAAERLGDAVPEEWSGGGGRWALDEIRRSDPRSVMEAAEALGRFSSHDWIGEIDVPVAVVIPESDRLVPVKRQVKLAEAIPSAVVHVVNGDHLACTKEGECFSQTLLEACQLVVRRAADHKKAIRCA